MHEKPKPNKSRFEAISIKRVKNCELLDKRNRKGNDDYKEGNEMGREMKKEKVGSNEKSLMKVPQFSKNVNLPHKRLQPPDYKMAFPNKKANMEEREAHSILE